MVNAGVEPLAIIQGTSNKWFFKYAEVHQALLLKDTINDFFQDVEVPPTVDQFNESDWELLLVYENSMKSIVEAAKVLEGELYPTASSVIPFLDTVFEDLKLMSRSVHGAGKLFVDKLVANLSRRFPGGYKQTKPYNCLTLLDVRHADLYFSPDDFGKAVNDLAIDDHFDEALIDNVHEDQGLAHVQDVPPQAEPSQDSFS